uniref:Synaptotagmin-like protein 4 n=1 Tax=Oncorhynchus tshawytscha TaxID=74940 RepID=A0AAZ3S7W1_ONCTS
MPQAADMINMAFLTDSERELILEVLRRDEELRQAEEQRVRKLKTELLDIKRKGAKRSSGRYSERSCGRCQEPLGRLSASSSQCRACKHQVCRNCRAVRPNGSWVCSVCAKEADLKKCTGDWFYDQRVNRFTTTPGHDIVRASLKKRSPLRKRETMGEQLLKSTELKPGQPTIPVPRPRLMDLAICLLSLQDDEEDDEDIDNLVSIHRKTVGSSTSNLRGSKSTLGSLMSIYSEAGDYDCVEVSGDIVFSLSYDDTTHSLAVLVKECHSLAHGDATRQRSNPYVKCYLLPDKSRTGKKKTSIKRNTVDPTYNEILKFSISRSQVLTRSLQLSVWHHDRLGRNAFLGEVEVPLDCRDLDGQHEECVALMGKASPLQSSAFSQYKGELVISLKYVSTKKPPTEKTKGNKSKTEEGGELHVLIKEAKNLTAMKAGDTSDSFVKGYLLPSKSKSTKRKTPVVKKTLNPHYDHTFVYKDLTLDQLSKMCLELTVWDREAISSNDFLGGVRLSTGTATLKVGKEEVEADSTGEEVSLWQKMMQYPDSWAEGSLPLRSSMGKNKSK